MAFGLITNLAWEQNIWLVSLQEQGFSLALNSLAALFLYPQLKFNLLAFNNVTGLNELKYLMETFRSMINLLILKNSTTESSWLPAAIWAEDFYSVPRILNLFAWQGIELKHHNK